MLMDVVIRMFEDGTEHLYIDDGKHLREIINKIYTYLGNKGKKSNRCSLCQVIS